MENERKHFRHVMLHCFKRGKNANDTANEICTVYGNNATSVQTVRSWFKKFRAGNFNLEDEESCGRPSTTNTDLIIAMVEENPRYTLREVADSLKIPRTTVHNHLIKLSYINRADVWLPHELTDRNKLERISTCDLVLQRHNNQPFLKRLVTGDESWILYENITRKRSWTKGTEPLTVGKPGLHPKTILLCIWWDWKGVLYYDLLEQGETINSTKYCSQLDKLKDAITTKRPELVNR